MNQGNQIIDEVNINIGEIIALLVFVIGDFISFLVSYNKACFHYKKKPLFREKTGENIILINKIVLFMAVLYFLYNNYRNYEKSKGKGDVKTERSLLLQVISSILLTIASMITLYVIFKNFRDNNEAFLENPEI